MPSLSIANLSMPANILLNVGTITADNKNVFTKLKDRNYLQKKNLK